jgi:anthranilate phosphoribosyltransferase
VLEKFGDQLQAGQHLAEEQVRAAVEDLVSETVPASVKAEFLSRLATKGETSVEIAAFARALREKSIQPPLDPAWRDGREILDVCGTGGDRLGTFNISTTVAIICAAAGVAVAKHGNRAITSQAGSADVLEALGVRVDLPPTEAAQSLRERNFAFFFAPNYHPAFKHIAPARKLCAERGQRTIFNFLGPLLNPARPTAQLVGVPRPELCEPIARVLQSLGVRRGRVVCGNVSLLCALRPFELEQTNRVQKVRVMVGGRSEELSVSDAFTRAKRENALLVPLAPHANPPVYIMISSTTLEDIRQQSGAPVKQINLDELSTLGENTIAEFYQEHGFISSVMKPDNFPLQPATLADLIGGDRNANAEIVRLILDGDDRGPKRDAVLLNAAAALFVSGQARTLTAGWDLAADVIDSGRATAKLNELKRN